MTDVDVIQQIRDELSRVGADRESVGPIDAISVGDRGEGYAHIQGSSRRRDFFWFGKAEEIRDRLAGLPDVTGPEAVRSEFHEGRV